ncbi:MAG TPA: GatB/YqeY domain-containing protein [Nitrospirae bacterium]|nr:GatB/YqeY domain-containing protein [Nitrospirota bacterium]
MNAPLLKRIEADLKDALKRSDRLKVSVLRMIKASIKNKEIEKGSPLSDEEIISVLTSLSKQRRESIEEFRRAGREELVEKETAELSVLQSYMPEQLSEEELNDIINSAIQESGATSVRDIGKVMKIVMPRVKGRADGKVVNQKVRAILESSD